MSKRPPKNELRYFDALKRIASYASPDRMRRDEERGRGYGLEPSEAIEMAYENVISEAKAAIKGRRRPAALREQKDASHDR